MKMHEHEHEEKPTNTIDYSESYLKLADKRTIVVSEDVTVGLSNQISAMLMYYDTIDPGKDITMYINTNGGDVDALINIYDFMQMIESPISTVVIGKAYSARSVMLCAGAKGKRYAFKNAKVMVHGIQCTYPHPGQYISDSKNLLEHLKDAQDKVMQITADHCGKSLEDLKKLVPNGFNLFMNAEEALEFGIIDHII